MVCSMRIFYPFYIKTESFADCVYDFSTFSDDFWPYPVAGEERDLILRHICTPFKLQTNCLFYYEISNANRLSMDRFPVFQRSEIIFRAYSISPPEFTISRTKSGSGVAW